MECVGATLERIGSIAVSSKCNGYRKLQGLHVSSFISKGKENLHSRGKRRWGDRGGAWLRPGLSANPWLLMSKENRMILTSFGSSGPTPDPLIVRLLHHGKPMWWMRRKQQVGCNPQNLNQIVSLKLDAQATPTPTPVHRLINTCSPLPLIFLEGTSIKTRNLGFIDY